MIAAVLILLALIRILGLDSRAATLIAVSTAWPLVVLPGLLVIVGAAALRWRSLGVAALLCLVIVAAAWVPAWTGNVGPGAAGAARVRVLALNVQYSQSTGPAATEQIRQADPDVVVLSELSPRNLQGLDLSQYPHSWQRPQSDAFGQGIWSRWPLTSKTTWSDWGVRMMQVTVEAPNGAFRLYQVHTRAPNTPLGRSAWRSQLERLKGYLADEHLPVVAAGDYNASRWDSNFEDLLGGANRIDDANAGRGYLATWPSGWSWLPPVLPLDHILISRGIGVRDIRSLSPVGSDHRALVADLIFPEVG